MTPYGLLENAVFWNKATASLRSTIGKFYLILVRQPPVGQGQGEVLP